MISLHVGFASALALGLVDSLTAKNCPKDHLMYAAAVELTPIAYVLYRRAPLMPFFVGFYSLYISMNLTMALREINHPELRRHPAPPAQTINVKASLW